MSSVCYYIIDKHKLTRWLDKGDSVRRNVDINKPTLIIEIILPLRITTTDNPNSGEKSGVLGKKPTNIRERAGILKENQQASTRKPVYSGTAIRHRREDHSSWNTKQASRGRPQLREYQTSIEGKTTAQGIPNRHWGEAWVLGETNKHRIKGQMSPRRILSNIAENSKIPRGSIGKQVRVLWENQQAFYQVILVQTIYKYTSLMKRCNIL